MYTVFARSACFRHKIESTQSLNMELIMLALTGITTCLPAIQFSNGSGNLIGRCLDPNWTGPRFKSHGDLTLFLVMCEVHSSLKTVGAWIFVRSQNANFSTRVLA